MNQSYRNGEMISKSGELCLAQRIISGIAMIYQEDQSNKNFIRLAIIGDIIGIESIYHDVSKFNVIALTNVTCKKFGIDVNNLNLLEEAYVQQQERMLDTAKLRTSSIADRLGYLIDILAIDLRNSSNTLYRDQLPSLRDMAFIINSVPETVSRGLSKIIEQKYINYGAVNLKQSLRKNRPETGRLSI